mgnify:CR=1 FL=1
MKKLKQICLILLFSLLGELCRFLIPFPIPASIYGMMLLFGALSLKIVKVEEVKYTGAFLTTILPLLFVAPVVNLMDCWNQLKDNLIPLLIIVLTSTVVVFAVSGTVTQLLMGRRKEKGGEGNA